MEVNRRLGYRRNGDGDPASLRRTWAASAVQSFGIVVILGVLAVGLTWYSHNVYRDATVHAQSEIGALTELKGALVEMSTSAPPVLYMLGGEGSPDENLRRYTSASQALSRSFETAERTFREEQTRERLHAMNEVWLDADAVVKAAGQLDVAALNDMLTSGIDPFEVSFWTPTNELDAGISSLYAHVGETLGSQVGTLDRLYKAALPGVVLAIVAALFLMWRASRRMARQVVGPVMTLRAAAASLATNEWTEPIKLGTAVEELHALAATLNNASASLRATHDELRKQAGCDPLTGLPNRRAFTELLDQAFGNADSLGTAVLYLDLDDFKVVNDSLGHAAGDELLRICAQRLSGVTVGGDATVARLGGDEFAVIMRSQDVYASGPQLAQRILDTFVDPVVINGATVNITCSIGIDFTRTHTGAASADDLMRNADFAMYMAKSQGKHRFEIFSPALHDELQSGLKLQGELSQAVERRELVLEYQPIVEIASRALLGFEALVRWNHPTRGRVAPAEFISIAEDTGDIVAIGNWVLDEACRALAEHHRNQDPSAQPLTMSVNVSPVQLAQPEFADTVAQALSQHRLPPDTLSIEITESVAIADIEHAVGVLDRIRATGVKVALDDFGPGYASLRSLHDLPIDVIKIDRSFLVDIGCDGESRALLEAIVNLGRTLGKVVIAEGVETAEDLARLSVFDIAGQGYLFARPLSAQDAADYRRAAAVAHRMIAV
jgi:diguanylate cyclase (GGDEF)-like protein